MKSLVPIDPLDALAPSGDMVIDYDRRHLLTYAELLDADDAGVDWRGASLEILGVDPAIDEDTARRCWDSHLARARWIIGEGLGSAVEAFAKAASRRKPG